MWSKVLSLLIHFIINVVIQVYVLSHYVFISQYTVKETLVALFGGIVLIVADYYLSIVLSMYFKRGKHFWIIHTSDLVLLAIPCFFMLYLFAEKIAEHELSSIHYSFSELLSIASIVVIEFCIIIERCVLIRTLTLRQE